MIIPVTVNANRGFLHCLCFWGDKVVEHSIVLRLVKSRRLKLFQLIRAVVLFHIHFAKLLGSFKLRFLNWVDPELQILWNLMSRLRIEGLPKLAWWRCNRSVRSGFIQILLNCNLFDFISLSVRGILKSNTYSSFGLVVWVLTELKIMTTGRKCQILILTLLTIHSLLARALCNITWALNR